jgi:transcriptional regulator with XRE-family HTH domain
METRGPEAEEFGRRVRAHRTALGVSQMALAEAAGLHFTFVSSVERGRRNVTLPSIVRLAGALGVDPGELVGGMKAPKGVRRAG